MAQMAMIAGLGMMCLSSSVGAALMMGGGEEDDGAGGGGAGGAGGAGDAGGGADEVVIRDEKTTENDAAGGSMIHLDRHDVDCGEDGLTGFVLKKTGDNKMLYEYSCRDDINTPLEAQKNTGSNDWGNNNTIYLDRHTMDCGNKAIGQFRLNRPANNTIMYNYKCSGKEATGTCREDLIVTSTKTGHSKSKTTSLDDVHPKCNDDEVLTKVQFLRHNPNTSNETGSYKYTCCKM
jgi:hypothetical protein